MSARLAKVADPKALDASDGIRARLKITVPEAWLHKGTELEITTPKLLSCDRCDGGGCDGCERSGAFRAPKDESERTLRVLLAAQEGKGVMIRLVEPFDENEIEQLMLRVSIGDEASAGVRQLLKPVAVAQAQFNKNLLLAVAIAVLIAIAVVIFTR
jgi:hypothetical protein